MALDFQQAFRSLNDMGVMDVLLPFLLVFTLVFAVFQKTKILGENAKKFNVIIAMVTGFAVVMPHINGTQPDVVPIINSALPSVGAVAVAIIMALFLIGVWGLDLEVGGYTGLLGVLSMLTVAYIFGASAGWFERYGMLDFLFDSDTQALLVIILIFAIIISFITKEEDKNKTPFSEMMNKMFKKTGK